MSNPNISDNQFKDYAAYYDLLNQDKDYFKEAKYIHDLIQKHKPKTKTILSLGCGTGRYENEIAKYGYEITGVDISSQMIEIAEKSKAKNCLFASGDIREIRLDQKFDAVISLFHVMSYMTSDEDLSRAFKTAEEHLNSGGIFIFDFWHGPAVLADPPYSRTKAFENDKLKVDRTAYPLVSQDSQLVTIDYKIEVFNKLFRQKQYFYETHKLRYLFMQEIETLLNKVFLHLNSKLEWLSYTKEPDSNSWYALVIATIK
ncbi:MAG TPA: SAM-dependent methyltransferase [Lentisphaeria bacterium]|nr:MAG: hypothetical protein A2X47_09125 [Lentisphaerae bacterium GWF2_38_69]HBM15439.1 SAM-dependent methyltransferase [Lentisphaeria bacterium]